MEMKNICGRIPVELHAKVRGEIEQRGISTPEFLQQVIEEHFLEPMFTITATDRHGIVYHGRIRRLIPRECLRLQGYYDSQIDRMIAGMSDRQLYKQAGNGVTVTVVEAIGRNLKAVDEELRLEDTVYAD